MVVLFNPFGYRYKLRFSHHQQVLFFSRYARPLPSPTWIPTVLSIVDKQEEVLTEAVDAFKADFVEAKRQGALMERQIGQFFPPAGPGGGGAGHDAPPTGDAIGEDRRTYIHTICELRALSKAHTRQHMSMADWILALQHSCRVGFRLYFYTVIYILSETI